MRIGGKAILKEITWSFPRGSHAALLGPNGSGKSTLLRIITGYQFPSSGNVRVLGFELGHVDLHQLRRAIGIVDPGNPYPFARRMSVLDVVLTGFFGNRSLDFDHPTPEQMEQARAALVEVGLAGHENQSFHTLSTGETRRVLLARALVPNPQLLILDEPTAGLDLLGRETMLATIDSLIQTRPELTTLLVTHHVEEISPRTGEVLLLRAGTICARGLADQVLCDEYLGKAFGCPVTVRKESGRWYWQVEPKLWQRLANQTR